MSTVTVLALVLRRRFPLTVLALTLVGIRNEPAPGAVPTARPGGRGLAGLAEQVADARGVFTYGKTEEGGFCVRASF